MIQRSVDKRIKTIQEILDIRYSWALSQNDAHQSKDSFVAKLAFDNALKDFKKLHIISNNLIKGKSNNYKEPYIYTIIRSKLNL